MSRLQSASGTHVEARGARRVITAFAITLAVLASLLAPTTAVASETATPSPAILAAQTYPVIQLVQVDWTSTISVPDATLDEAAFQALIERLTLQALSGSIGISDPEVLDAMVAEIVKDPFRYFLPADTTQTVDVALSGFGTGFVVNPDGYLVTAAHVVDPGTEELTYEFARSGLVDIVQQEIDIAASEGTFSQQNLDDWADAMFTWYAHYATIGDIQTSVTAQVGVAVAGIDKTMRGQPVEVISVGEAYPGKDVALLKLDGANRIPTLPLGQDSDVSEGSTLHVAGYPAASTFSSGMSADSEVQPTITQGPLTAIKETAGGVPIFQTQAPASPGNSGGPVLDDQGDVIGILVAAAVDDGGVALEGQEFVIPISVVRQMLNENNITPAPSETTTAYTQALRDYDRKYYERAMPEFQRVKALYPEHPYVNEFIANTQTAIDQGKDETPTSMLVWGGIGGGGLLLLLLIGGGVFLVLRNRKKSHAPRSMPQGATQPVHAGAPGPWGQPSSQGYPGQPGQGYPQAPPPGGYAAPGQQAPGYPAPGQQPPAYPQSGYPTPGQQSPSYSAPGQQGPGHQPAPGQQAPGYPPPGAQPSGYPPPPGTAPGQAPPPAGTSGPPQP